MIMIKEYDFEYAPSKTNPYIPADLLQQDEEFKRQDQKRAIRLAKEEARKANGGASAVGADEEFDISGKFGDEFDEEIYDTDGMQVLEFDLSQEDDDGDYYDESEENIVGEESEEEE